MKYYFGLNYYLSNIVDNLKVKPTVSYKVKYINIKLKYQKLTSKEDIPVLNYKLF